MIDLYKLFNNKDSTLKFGDLMSTDEFIEELECGGITDYDGVGCCLDVSSGSIKRVDLDDDIFFDPDEMKKLKDKYEYVIWYNK